MWHFLFGLDEIISACCAACIANDILLQSQWFNKQSLFGECCCLDLSLLCRASDHAHDDLLAAVGQAGHEVHQRRVRHVDRLAAVHRPEGIQIKEL